MKDNKHIQSFNEHQENLNISDVISRLYDKVSKDTNAERDRIVASNFRGKLSFYELDSLFQPLSQYLKLIFSRQACFSSSLVCPRFST